MQDACNVFGAGNVAYFSVGGDTWYGNITCSGVKLGLKGGFWTAPDGCQWWLAPPGDLDPGGTGTFDIYTP